MQTIKIFLGSSIDELREERLFLSDYLLNSVRPIFKRDGVDIEVVKCEDIRTGYKGQSSQEEINDLLRGCNISIFMFKTKAGPQTVREYNVAQGLVDSKTHEIYVYCFGVSEEEKEKSLRDFKQQMRQIELYWKTCKDVNDLEKQFVIGLLDYERQLLGITDSSAFELENETAKDGDTLYKEFEHNKQALHIKIEELLQQTKTVMADEDETIAARIFKAIELYKKADLWASKTDYNKEKYSDLLSEYAMFLYDYGLYHDAETIYLRQIEFAEALYGKEHDKTATSYNNIGMVYMEQGDYGNALEYYQKALEIMEKVLGTENPDTAPLYNNIGDVYRKQGDYNKAIQHFLIAINIINNNKEKDHNEMSPIIAKCYDNIGGTYYEQGNYAMALPYHLKALEIENSTLGEEHPDFLITNNNIGTVYYSLGDYNNALLYYKKALAILKKMYDCERPIIATIYNNIGDVYMELEEYYNAFDYYFRALTIRERIYGLVHPDTATTFNGIGSVFYALSDYGKAKEYYLKTLNIREKVLGTQHPHTAFSYNNVGSVYNELGDYDKALKYLLKALVILKETLGTENLHYATSNNITGWIYKEKGEYNKALEYFTNSYQIRKNILGEEHPKTQDVLKSINIVKQFLQQSPQTPTTAP